MDVTLMLAGASLLVAAVSVLPGSLGFAKLTHKLTAKPVGAYVFLVLALPMWLASLALLVAAIFLAIERSQPLTGVGAASVGFVALSGFGFLMHLRFQFKPVREPLYLSLDEAIERFGDDEEVAGVLDRQGRAFAYIARLARRPHVVYQSEGEAPFILSHCILSHSSMAYELDDRFRGDGLYISSVLANNLVFYDRGNHCTVLQIHNRARNGSYELKTLPTLMTSLGAWKRYYPESKVWYRPKEWRDTFYLKLLARASVIDPASPDLVYPLEREPDPRLPLKAFVFGVSFGGDARAYPHEALKEHRLVEDTVGGEPIVLLANEDADFVQLFSRSLDGERTLHFRGADDGFEDVETGSTWTVAGECVAGDLRGRELDPIPHYNKIFWCVWADYFPTTKVWSAPG